MNAVTKNTYQYITFEKAS